MNKQTKLKLLTSIIVIFGFLAFSYWSYRIAIGVSQEALIVTQTPVLKMQYECLQKNDIECVEKTNEILLILLSAQMEAHKKTRMAGSFKDFIDEHLLWYESVKNR